LYARAVLSTLVTLVVLSLAFPRSASAHPLAPALLELQESPSGTVVMRLKTPVKKATRSRLKPNLPAQCDVPRALKRSVDDTAVVEEFEAHCAPGLAGTGISVAGIADSRANVILKTSLADGREFTSILTAGEPTFSIPQRAKPAVVLGDYVTLGFEHILSGLDHVLFLLGLVLLSTGLRSLLLTVTMFTVGHSVTLTCAMLGWVHVPQGAVEIMIALSICVLALEVLKSSVRGPTAQPTAGRRFLWLIALSFGLLHGFGFAGALATIGLPVGDIPLSLFSFNIGIEVGQLLLVAGLLVIGAAWTRLPRRDAIPVPGRALLAYAMGTLSVYWVLERSQALLNL
jgi:hydrogenase/urease accessory protein HupE